MEPENEDGNVEYKLKLDKSSDERIKELISQMRYRCEQGEGECFYNIGVEDNGTLFGLTDEEYKETIKILNIVAEKNNYSVQILTKTPVKDTKVVKNVYEVLIRENTSKYIDIKVCVAGHVDAGKCVGFNTPIIMYDGKIKMIQDIKKGDLLMGDDSTPRTVLETTTGSGELYEIFPLNGDSYKVNKNHILCFKISCHDTVSFDKSRNRFKIRWMELIDNIPVIKEKRMPVEFSKIESENELKNTDKLKGGDIIELTFEQYINLPINTQNALKLYKTGIEFPEKDIPIDPYMIGYWLGDGTSTDSEITTQDSTTVKYFKTNLEKYKCYLQYRNNKGTNKYKYRINGNGTIGGNLFLTALKNLNLIDNKHIPDIYKYNSRENRLKLLAGLIDSDGSYSKRNIFEFSQSLEHGQLMDDVVYLCRSLGFACYKNKTKTTWTHKGIKKTGEAWKMNIMGEDIENIPTLCPRKKASKRISPKNVLVTGIDKIIASKKKEKYYGFELDGNGRFLLGDFSVTHNSSILGSLVTGQLDNGRGLSRMSVFNYVHELKTGRTSSISHEILGYDHKGAIVNYQSINKLSWNEIVSRSSKIISFFDLAGHEKYLKTTILGLSTSIPNLCMIMISANNGISKMTREHIFLCLTLKIPFIFVISKIDLCDDKKNVLDETIQGINKLLKHPTVRRIAIHVKNNEDIILSAKNIYSNSITPVFQISNVTGKGLDDIRIFFNIIGKKPNLENNDNVEYFVDNIFQVKGVGIVLGGHLLSGTIRVSDNLLIGPLDDGKYESVTVKSLHSKKVNVQSVSYGGYVCVALKKIDKKIVRKGIVLISQKSEQISISTFCAKINVMRSHATTIKVGYEPLLCINSIRQTVQIIEIKDKKNARNIDNSEDDNILRTNDSAVAKLKFKYRPEYLKSGTRFIMCEGNLKIVGEIL